MQEAAVLTLNNWANFYVIIGSAATALTGLMFVVITLIAGAREQRSGGSIAAFGTPTVVHFGAALVIAAIVLPGHPTPALFIIGAATVLLLFIGIHNAWDTVAYLVVERYQPEDQR